MIISIRGKKKNNKVGHLKVSRSGFKILCNTYQKQELTLEIQEVLMKYFDLKIISQGGEITNQYIHKELKKDYNNLKKRATGRGRGSRIGNNIKKSERNQTDLKYRKRTKEIAVIYSKSNREKINKRHKKWVKKLNEFKNKRCILCNSLLNYRTKGDKCMACRKK